MPVSMPASSKEEYELLPSYDDHGSEPEHVRRQAKLNPLRLVRRGIRRHPTIIFLCSLTFVLLSVAFLAYDVAYVKAKLTLAGSYGNESFTRLWPVGLANRTDVWENENSNAMHALISCMSADDCKENQDSIILLSSHHFADAIIGHVSGEDIWAASVLDAVRELGYTPIVTTNNEELAYTYRQYPDLVKIIILDAVAAETCFSDEKCVKTVNHPSGIPAWKMFSFHFWAGNGNPLGNAWTLSPENWPLISPQNSRDNYYLGYSIEKTCLHIPITPNEERPRQAYVLAKETLYFSAKEYAWPALAFDAAPIDVELIAGIARYNPPPLDTLPKGITDVGKLNKTQFYEHLGRSRVLVGIGRPVLSPSPYDALCMGVPFINPVLDWDAKRPEDRTLWRTQHEGLKYQYPPYVYHVKKGDVDGFWEALRTAVETPIERYIIPDMTMRALKERLVKLIEGDWRERAEVLLNERKMAAEKGNGKLKLFEL